MERMKPTAYKIGEGERKGLSKDMQEVILAYQEENKELEKENKKLKESLDIATKCSSKEEDGIIRLSEENETLKDKIEFLTNCLDDRDKSIELLKEELEQYKKQYEHTMGED